MNANTTTGWSGYLGPLIGYSSWALVLSGVCLAGGRSDWVLELCLPALLVSLGLGLCSVLTLELVRRRYPDDRAFFQFTLWGRLLTDIGILLLLNTEWILPIIRGDESVTGLVGVSLNSTIYFPGWIGMICLAVGCVISFSAAHRILKEPLN